MNLKEIGLRIKNHRQIQAISQRELAEKIGTTWEMVSRYETGKSSPMSRIDLIAKALNVPVSRLLQPEAVEDTTISYRKNLVPLLSNQFSNLNTELRKTKIYYAAPDWIMQKFSRPFAVETSALKIKTTQISSNGVIFAVQEEPTDKNDLVIATEKGEAQVTSLSTLNKSAKVIATVVAWEKRFK